MSDKILTVSVAAYNMHDYLEQCLDSCVCADSMDVLEVIIVDDGSVDDTAEIAQRYVDRFPGTFRLVSKANGGYGTTVNASMRVAKGKYFRLLDADDWFAPGSVETLLGFLETCDDDIVVTPMYRCAEGAGPSLASDSYGIALGETIAPGNLPASFYLSMWRLTAKTNMLRRHPFELPEHCVFTDQLFVVNCIARANSVVLADIPLYCYRIGRDGQTVSPESRIAHFEEIESVLLEELALFESLDDDSVKRALLGTISAHYGTHMKVILMLPRSWSNYRKIRGMESYLSSNCPELYKIASESRKIVRVLRATNYIAYWVLTLLDLKQKKYWEQR